jgi:hypothetical protein
MPNFLRLIVQVQLTIFLKDISSFIIDHFFSIHFSLNICVSGILRCIYIALLINNQLDAQFFFMYVYFYSLHVSGSHVPIIRRINCIDMTSGICHYVQMTI